MTCQRQRMAAWLAAHRSIAHPVPWAIELGLAQGQRHVEEQEYRKLSVRIRM